MKGKGKPLKSEWMIKWFGIEWERECLRGTMWSHHL
jgi:hypothetical protein